MKKWKDLIEKRRSTRPKYGSLHFFEQCNHFNVYINGWIFLLNRLLCLDALIEEGDHDQDWRLSKLEFATLMGYDYQPSNKCEDSTLCQLSLQNSRQHEQNPKLNTRRTRSQERLRAVVQYCTLGISQQGGCYQKGQSLYFGQSTGNDFVTSGQTR